MKKSTMSRNSEYQYMIEVVRQDGSRLDRYPITPDWVPAHEWCHFLGVRRGTLPISANLFINIRNSPLTGFFVVEGALPIISRDRSNHGAPQTKRGAVRWLV